MTFRDLAIVVLCVSIIAWSIALPAIGWYYGSIECGFGTIGVVAFWAYAFGRKAPLTPRRPPAIPRQRALALRWMHDHARRRARRAARTR